MNPEEINYSGQYLNNTEHRIKIRTGSDIENAKNDAICGEMLLVTGASPAIYVCTETAGESDAVIYKLPDLSLSESCVSSPLSIIVDSEYDVETSTSRFKYTTRNSDGVGSAFGCISALRGSTLSISVVGHTADLQTHPIKITEFNDQGQHGTKRTDVVRTDNTDGSYTLTWEVPCDTTIDKYQYQCESHSSMRGVINVFGACVDSDGDGILDGADSHPGDSNQSGVDADNDGLDDAIDPDPNDPDSDDDGILDGVDSHPSDSTQSGIDSDNDGVDDVVDAFPNNADFNTPQNYSVTWSQSFNVSMSNGPIQLTAVNESNSEAIVYSIHSDDNAEIINGNELNLLSEGTVQVTISIPATYTPSGVKQHNELPAGTVVNTFTITDDLGGNSIDETPAEYEPYVSAWAANADSANRPYILEVSHSMGVDSWDDPVVLQDLVVIDIRAGSPDDEYKASNGASMTPMPLGDWESVSSWEDRNIPGPVPPQQVFQKAGSIITMSREIPNESSFDRNLAIYRGGDTSRVAITVKDQLSFFLDRRPNLIPPQVHSGGQFPGSAVFDSETGSGDVVINNKNFSSAYTFSYDGNDFSYYQNLLFNDDGSITFVSMDEYYDNGNNSNYGSEVTYDIGTWDTSGITFNTNWQGSAQEYQDNAGVSFYNKFNLYYIGT